MIIKTNNLYFPLTSKFKLLNLLLTFFVLFFNLDSLNARTTFKGGIIIQSKALPS